ncbi:unnamed protein product [Moneuplotes crassus]|uniref:Uncharacterized protein n=1 Tax=Euplotes crassus TaxID=5936 RepID=A0AAD1XHI5_EUPCR|nr:unnamed protein product [Moneuplotes crassus]
MNSQRDITRLIGDKVSQFYAKKILPRRNFRFARAKHSSLTRNNSGRVEPNTNNLKLSRIPEFNGKVLQQITSERTTEFPELKSSQKITKTLKNSSIVPKKNKFSQARVSMDDIKKLDAKSEHYWTIKNIFTSNSKANEKYQDLKTLRSFRKNNRWIDQDIKSPVVKKNEMIKLCLTKATPKIVPARKFNYIKAQKSGPVYLSPRKLYLKYKATGKLEQKLKIKGKSSKQKNLDVLRFLDQRRKENEYFQNFSDTSNNSQISKSR